MKTHNKRTHSSKNQFEVTLKLEKTQRKKNKQIHEHTTLSLGIQMTTREKKNQRQLFKY